MQFLRFANPVVSCSLQAVTIAAERLLKTAKAGRNRYPAHHICLARVIERRCAHAPFSCTAFSDVHTYLLLQH